MLASLQRLAFARGLTNKRNQPWLIAAAALWLVRKALTLRKRQSEVVYRSVLKPGESLHIDHSLLDQRGKPSRGRTRG
ncbi:MAG: hypothetical protein WC184_01525 [Acidimicrobiia bacterium]